MPKTSDFVSAARFGHPLSNFPPNGPCVVAVRHTSPNGHFPGFFLLSRNPRENGTDRVPANFALPPENREIAR